MRQNKFYGGWVVGVKGDFSVSLCPFLRSFWHMDTKWTQSLTINLYPSILHTLYFTFYGDRIWYRENGVPKNWIWPQKCEILWRGHPLIPLVAPKKVHRCPKKPPEDLAKFWLKMPLLTFWSIVGSFLHRYASVIPFWKAET